MKTGVKQSVLFVALAAACLHPARASAQSITVAGDHFVADWNDGTGPHARFLMFISYFDALRATNVTGPTGDLQYIKSLGFDGVRVLPNWQRRKTGNWPGGSTNTSAYCFPDTEDPDARLLNPNGTVRGDPGASNNIELATGPLKKLVDLIKDARDRQMVVDVTFTHETYDPFMSFASYKAGVTRVAQLLQPYRNVLFDLQNEIEKWDDFDKDQIRDIRRAITDPGIGVDPQRIVVVSYSGTGLSIPDYNAYVGTSVIAYHDARGSGWQLNPQNDLPGLRPSGKPVYLQEPTAWNSGLRLCDRDEGSSTQEDDILSNFRDSLTRARTYGAAAWTFHTRQGFRLHDRTLQSLIQADDDEVALLTGPDPLSGRAHSGTWGISPVVLGVTVNGTGSVTSAPGGINCQSNCSFTFPAATTVTLTAQTGASSVFTGWSGGGCSGTSTCQVTASSNVTATFATTESPVTVALGAPADGVTVFGRFVVDGWAIDRRATANPGISSVTVWARPVAGGSPISLGPATIGVSRPDVAATYGSQFTNSGFSLPAAALPVPGSYDIYVIATSNIDGLALQSTARRITFRQIPPTDLDGDGLGDLIVWRPSEGKWYWLKSSTGYQTGTGLQWGNESLEDVPLLGDMDGDGKSDLIVWRASTGTWYWLTSSTGYSYTSAQGLQWGNHSLGDVPLVGDFDQDGKADLCVWRASTGTFYWLTSSTGYSYASAHGMQWGNQGDVPFLTDMDGDGRSDLVVWRASDGTWYWKTSSSGYVNEYGVLWGNSNLGDVPRVGDFDGDHRTDLAVWRASNGTWYWLTSSTGYSYATAHGVLWGNAAYGDHPYLPDIDGDGLADLAVWRANDGTWYWLTSSTGYTYATAHGVLWGNNGLGDVPIVR